MSVFFESGDILDVELVEVADAEAETGYVNLEARARATYQFPVLYGEAWEPFENGELEDLEADEEQIFATGTRTVDLRLSLDAAYDPGTRRLSNFELTAAEEA